MGVNQNHTGQDRRGYKELKFRSGLKEIKEQEEEENR